MKSVVLSVLCVGLVFSLVSVFGCSKSNLDPDNCLDPGGSVFFSKWVGSLGYALFEGKGHLGIPYLNYDKSKEFENSIASVKLLPTNQVIDISNYSILQGSSSEELDIRTIYIYYNLIGTVVTDINQILISMNNGVTYTWSIGSIRIEVVDLVDYSHFNLGVRQFVSSHIDEYFFTLWTRFSNA